MPYIAGMAKNRSADDTARTTDKPDRRGVDPNAGETPRRPREIGGPKEPEPTRYGDWEIGGRCIDF